MVSPCLNLCKANWFKTPAQFAVKRRHCRAKSTTFVSQAASLDDLPRQPLAALYASGPKALPTWNMGLSCAEINDAAVQYQDRRNYRAFHTHVAIRAAIRFWALCLRSRKVSIAIIQRFVLQLSIHLYS